MKLIIIFLLFIVPVNAGLEDWLHKKAAEEREKAAFLILLQRAIEQEALRKALLKRQQQLEFNAAWSRQQRETDQYRQQEQLNQQRQEQQLEELKARKKRKEEVERALDAIHNPTKK